MATNQPDVRIRLSAEGVKEVVQALKQVQAQAGKSAQQANSVGGGMAAASQGVAALKGAVGALAAAAAGLAVLDKMKDWAAHGVALNASYEKANVGLAGVLASQAKLVDGSGQVLKGQDAYAAAVQLSADYMEGLQEKAAAAGVDYASLAAQSRVLVFTGLNAGIKDMDKLQQLTVASAKMMTTFGEDVESTSEQLKNLLRGEGSDITDALGIDDDTLKRWKDQGTLVDQVLKRINASEAATKAYANSWAGLTGRMKAALNTLTQGAFSGMFAKLKTGVASALDALTGGTGKLRPEVQAVADTVNRIASTIGGAIAAGVAAFGEGMRSAGTWLTANSKTVEAIASSFNTVAGFVGQIAQGLGGVVGQMNLLTRAAGVVSMLFNTIAGYVNLTQQGIAKVLTLTAKDDAQRVYFENEAALAGKRAKLNERAATEGLKTAITGEAPAAGAAGNQAQTGKNKNKTRVGGSSLPSLPNAGAAAAAKAQADAIEQLKLAAADREAKLEQIRAKAAAAVAQETYNQGKQALVDYNAARLAAINAEADAELKVLQAQLARAKAMPTLNSEEAAQKKLAVYQAETALKAREAQRDADIAAQTRQNTLDQTALDEELKTVQADIAEKYGERGAAAKAALDAELKATEALLVKQGMAADKIAEYIAKLKAASTAALDFDAASSDIDTATGDADLAKRKVEADKASGKLWGFEAAAKVAAIEKERLANLESQAQALADIANGPGGTAEMKKKAADIAVAVEELRASTDEYGKAIASLKDTVETSLSSGLNDMLDQIVDGTATAKVAVRGFVRGLVDSFRKKAQELLIDQAIKPLMSMLMGPLSPQKAADTQRTAADTQRTASTKFEKAVDAFEKAVRNLGRGGSNGELDAILEKLKGANVAKAVSLASTAQEMPLFPSGEQIRDYLSQTADANQGGPWAAMSPAPWAKSAETISSAATSISTGAAALTDGAGQFSSSVSMFESAAGLISTASTLMQTSSSASSSIGTVMSLFSGSGYAKGGLIQGPGSATSDSVPTRLSNGEYVLKASAVKKLGVSTLDMLNATGSLQPLLANSYAAQSIPTVDGGVASSIQQAAGGGTSRIELGLEPGLFAKHIKSTEGQKAVVEVLATRRRSVKKATG